VRRPDLVALVQGVLVGAAVAVVAVLIWTAAARPAGFPTTAAALPSPFVLPTPTARPELPITLEADGLGIAFFGDDGANVVRGLETLLGTSNGDEHWTCTEPNGEVRFVQWADLGIFVIDGVFVGWVDAIYFPPEFGPLLEVTTREDLGIGVELEHFEAHLGDRFAFSEPAPSAAPDPSADPDQNPLADMREFDIDGPDGIHGFVEDSPEGSRVISLTAGTTCFDNGP
jgi:hypothetical protein